MSSKCNLKTKVLKKKSPNIDNKIKIKKHKNILNKNEILKEDTISDLNEKPIVYETLEINYKDLIQNINTSSSEDESNEIDKNIKLIDNNNNNKSLTIETNTISDETNIIQNEIIKKNQITYKDLGLCNEMCAACEALGWKEPTEIQEKSLPYSLNGRDIIGLAETGSGKTGAFILPILHSLLEQENHKGVLALVLSPTRELSMQISEQFLALGAAIGLRVCTILGGLDMVSQAIELSKKPHIIVATPGRILDHLENTKGFHLSTIKYLVLDEADRLLSLDFEDAIDKILTVLPKKRNTYLFSATMTDRVSKLQRASLVRPVKIHVNSKYDVAKNLVQHMKLIAPQFKYTYLVAILSYLKQYTFMIFTNTCIESKKVATCLHHLGFSAICLHGKMTQPQRLGALNKFKAANKKILVATEVGSRGLDIPFLDMVINFDVPMSSKDYVHRVGRTARAGRSGRALTFVTPYDVQTFQQIEIATKQRMNPYDDISENQWRGLHEKVEESRLLTERELKEEPPIKYKNYKGKHKNNHKY